MHTSVDVIKHSHECTRLCAHVLGYLAITFAVIVRLQCCLACVVRKIRKIVALVARALAGCFTLGKWHRLPSLVTILCTAWQKPLRDAVAVGSGAAVEKLSIAHMTDEAMAINT